MTRSRYTEQDVGAIIQRATELHEASAGRGDGTLGPEEIERIAAEMDIPAEHVRRAILEHEGTRPTEARRWIGLPSIRERVALLGPIDDDRWAEIVQRLRRHYGAPGDTDQVGEVRYWSRSVTDMGSELTRTEVTAVPEGNGAYLELQTRIPGVAFMAYFVAFIICAGIVGVVQDGSALPGALMFLFAGLGGLAGAGAVHGILGTWARTQERRFRDLMTSLPGTERTGARVETPEIGADAVDPEGNYRLDEAIAGDGPGRTGSPARPQSDDPDGRRDRRRER